MEGPGCNIWGTYSSTPVPKIVLGTLGRIGIRLYCRQYFGVLYLWLDVLTVHSHSTVLVYRISNRISNSVSLVSTISIPQLMSTLLTLPSPQPPQPPSPSQTQHAKPILTSPIRNLFLSPRRRRTMRPPAEITCWTSPSPPTPTHHSKHQHRQRRPACTLHPIRIIPPTPTRLSGRRQPA